MRGGCSYVVRKFDPDRDCPGSQAVERSCEVGSSGGGRKVSLLTDLLGDPLCRIRHSPSFCMLVAETYTPYGHSEIVGLIRGCIKTASCGGRRYKNHQAPIYAKLAYILGLRVSPLHRRMGIAKELLARMEDWFRAKGAEYAYMATESGNKASVALFTGRCGYTKFRTPSLLVHPVFAHRLPLPASIAIVAISPREAEKLYRCKFGATEFFPRDIDAVLANHRSLGSFLAAPAGYVWKGAGELLSRPPGSWAVISVWSCKESFKLELHGVPMLQRALARASRVVDRALPWLCLPSVPDLFHPFGVYFLYGLGGEGPAAPAMVKTLCRHAHNMARRDGGCAAVATEVAGSDPLRAGIPHWRRMSCAEDLWCVKRLNDDYSDGAVGDWTKAPPGLSIFVDPREV